MGNAGVFVAGKGLVNLGNFVCGGKVGGGLLLGKGLVGATGLVGGLAGSAAQQTPNRRAWSPHAGSRAIRKCYKGASDDEKAKSPSPSSKSSSSGRSSISSRSSKRSRRKRKKGKKKRSKSGS